MNYFILKEFLTKLGFITEKLALDNGAENNVLKDIWKHLGGEEKSHVTLNNVRMFLLAIMGTYVEPSLNK